MTRIRATCPSCGEVDLRPADVELEIVRLPDDTDDQVRDGSSYRFACPTCDDLVTKPADARIARLLTTGGVEVHVTEDILDEVLPAHPESPIAGPAFSWDDLLDFHLALESGEFEDAVRSLADHRTGFEV